MNAVQDLLNFTEKFHDKIRHFCLPVINSFGINEFDYYQISDAGTWMGVNLKRDWVEHYFSEKYYLIDLTIRHPNNFKNTVLYSKDFNSKETDIIHDSAKNKFKTHLNFIIINRISTGVEHFVFGTTHASQAEKLYKEIPLIKLFIREFKEEFQHLRRNLIDYQVDIASLIGPAFEQPLVQLVQEPIDRLRFLQEMGIKTLDNLSYREIDVVKCLIKGKTASEIARELFISTRTVEHHLEHIKEKLDCCSKSKLIQRIMEFYSIGYFDEDIL